MRGPSVLTLGNFDGPHIGHRAILQRARQIAGERGDAAVIAITFDPPPVRLLRPDAEPPRIATVPQRIAGLRDAGADEVVVMTPTPEMLAQSPAEFVEGLVERFSPVAIVEGPDFRFGKARAGDMQTLAELGKRHGFNAVTVQPQRVTLANLQSVPVSSSLVRWLVGRGRVADAAVCLGRPFSLTATIARGEQRGRTLGIPTANLDPQEIANFIIPADGVYAGYAAVDEAKGPTNQAAKTPENQKPSIKNPQSPTPAAISIGIKPTFGHTALTVEAHLLDTDFDGYGRTLTLYFTRWLRDQTRFPGLDTLKQQLQRDIQQVRDLASKHPSPALSALLPVPL